MLLGIESAGLIGCASHQASSGASRPAETVLGRSPDSPQLSTTEIDDVAAFGEVLVEGRTLTPVERRYLVEHIQDQTARSSEFLGLYRTTAITLDRLAGRRFASLNVSERIDLITRHRLAAVLTPGEELSDELHTLRVRAVPDLIRGYYSSPAGWVAVGYETFPGRCGDLTRYTRSEA